MNREQLLAEIRSAAASGVATKDDILDAFREGKGGKDGALLRHVGVTELLYYIGGIIVFLGIIVLCWQNWAEFNSFTRILVTFGSSIAAFVAGALFQSNAKSQSASQVFFFISFLLLPTGIMVALHEANVDVGTSGAQSMISLVLTAAALASFWLYKKTLFLAFAVAFGTWLYFAITSYLVGNSPLFYDNNFDEYRALIMGIAYVSLAFSFRQMGRMGLSDIMNGIGCIAFLGSALFLGGWRPEQNMFWELLFPALVFLTMFAGVHFKVRSFLYLGAIFLMIYVGKITSEYFQDSLGWPLSLVLAGFALMGIGYLTYHLNRKYITQKA